MKLYFIFVKYVYFIKKLLNLINYFTCNKNIAYKVKDNFIII